MSVGGDRRDRAELRQLAELAGAIEQARLGCWLDAGSLLGSVRDGRLIPWDKDIDLGCWSDQVPALRRTVRTLQNRGYHVRAYGYRGDLYQLKLRPQPHRILAGARSIDVTVFRRHGEIAWSPINCVRPLPARRFSVRWFLQRPLREYVIERWAREPNRQPQRPTLPRLELDVRTWVVPANHFLDTDEIELRGFTFRRPTAVEEYLELRYGAWRHPRQGWNYCEDDGAIDRRPPEVVVGSR